MKHPISTHVTGVHKGNFVYSCLDIDVGNAFRVAEVFFPKSHGARIKQVIRNGHITAPLMEGRDLQEDQFRHIPEKLKGNSNLLFQYCCKRHLR
jgi:hypothetical protein